MEKGKQKTWSMKRILVIAAVVAGLLMIPLVAMQFTSEVAWTRSDFAVMGVLLFVTGIMLNLVTSRMSKYKAVGAIAVVLVFLYVWAELAVGIFTNIGS